MTLRSLPAIIALALASPAGAADIAGLWSTPANGGQVEISRCGPQLCGRLVAADTLRANPDLRDVNNRDPALRTRAARGLLMLQGFTGGPPRWTGGKVYNPEDGRTYSGSIELVAPNRLKLKGCVIAPLCKTQVWTRLR